MAVALEHLAKKASTATTKPNTCAVLLTTKVFAKPFPQEVVPKTSRRSVVAMEKVMKTLAGPTKQEPQSLTLEIAKQQ